ncbi:MAG: hypothetical protein OXP37_09035 [Chloroflexota bacterium]|nr:hypothetical protein [Chloroflexota bacterium]
MSVDGQARLQIDINHLDSSDDDSSASPVIDELEKLLPKRHGRPYLPAFALTHPDEDHCRGFARLIDEVEIGEIWCTTRVLGESEEDLCDDAVEFRKEAERRLTASIDSNGDPGSGNRIRIIGGSAFLEDKFGGFSEDYISGPEEQISVIDGMDLAGKFSALVHAP